MLLSSKFFDFMNRRQKIQTIIHHLPILKMLSEIAKYSKALINAVYGSCRFGALVKFMLVEVKNKGINFNIS